jgi:hypothetical protein
MGVGVGCAHHSAAVLEYLNVVDEGEIAEGCGLACPCVDDGGDFGDGHASKGEGVIGVEAEDTTEAALGFGDEEWR